MTYSVSIVAAIIPVLFILLFILRPDSFSAVTVWPAWMWLAGGLTGFVVFMAAMPKRIRLLVFGLWLLFAVACCDESRGLLHFSHLSSMSFTSRNSNGIVRVISLNCGGGSAEALSEVTEFDPDIILIQESPSVQDVAKITKRMYGNNGSYFCGADASIICRGRGDIVFKDIRGIITDIQPSDNIKLRVGSIRLPTPSTRADLWSPECWNEYKNIRIMQRRILEKYKNVLIQSKTQYIIGGDFNLPAGDGAVRCLKPQMKDAYRESGSGLCNTIINDFPMHRIDQIWVSVGIQPLVMRVIKTKYSDHRMVVCDLRVNNKKE